MRLGSAKPAVSIKRNLLVALAFVIVCAAEGAAFIQSTGPLSIPDSDLHANSIYALATGQSFNPVERQGDPYGNQVKVQHITGDSRYLLRTGMHNGTVAHLLEEFRKAARQDDEVPHTPLVSRVLYDEHRASQESVDRQPERTVTVPVKAITNRSNQYFPIVYVPQALGVWVGMEAGLGPFSNWQLGRIFNFILFLVLYALAIAVLPRGNVFLAVAGVMPMTVFLASSLMADALYIGVATLFVAMAMRCADSGGRMSNGTLAVFVAMTGLLVFCKGVYVVLALLLMVLPKRVLSMKRKFVFVVVSMLVALPVYGVWSATLSSTFPTVNVADNLAYVGEKPVKIMVMVALSTVATLWQNFPLYFLDTAGFFVVLAAWVGYIVYNRRVFGSKDGGDGGRWFSVYRYALIAVVITLLIFVAIYGVEALIWNQLRYMTWRDYLLGMEERYFFPLVPLLLTVCYTARPSGDSVMMSDGN